MSKENKSKQQNSGGQRQEIKISDNIAGAEYANMMQILHTKEEFNLLFAHVLPPTGKMVGKITTSPGHFKRMIKAMQQVLEQHEKQFGEVDMAENPKDRKGKIGF